MRHYFRERFNSFDFGIVFISLIDVTLTFSKISNITSTYLFM